MAMIPVDITTGGSMTYKTLTTATIIMAALGLAACESIGTAQGVSNGKPVSFDYQQGFLDNDGKLKVTMPDGELFQGKFVQRSSSNSGDEIIFGKKSKNNGVIFNSSESTSSLTQALLIGNRGNTMKCQLELSNPGSGIDEGGIGSCQVSNGETVDLSFWGIKQSAVVSHIAIARSKSSFWIHIYLSQKKLKLTHYWLLLQRLISQWEFNFEEFYL